MSDSSGRRAGPWSKWFNRYLRDAAKITDGEKVFHSFRHTFIRWPAMPAWMKRCGTPSRGTRRGQRRPGLWRRFGLKTLAEAMGKIEVPKVVASLRAGA